MKRQSFAPGLLAAAAIVFLALPVQAAPVAGDANATNSVNALDIQLTVNAALGIPTGEAHTDHDCNGQVTAIDIQLVINAALGIPIDADGDGLCDAAESNLGTRPDVFDTDGGGVGDGQEVLIDGTDPLVAADDGKGWGPDSFTYDVTLSPETTYVDAANLGLLIESDTENHVYTFDAAGASQAGLDFASGRNLLVHGLAARRITAVNQENGGLVVETEYVTLNEIIAEGIVAWDYGVEFTPEKVRITPPANGFVVKNGDTVNVSFTMGDYTYTLEIGLGGETATVDFSITKGSATFTAEGTITRFRSKDELVFADNKVEQFDHALTGMNGSLTLSLVMAASGRDVVNIETPATILSFPFLVGAIPVELNIKAQFVINASVPVDGSSRVRATFTYGSDLGFAFNGVDLTAAGRLGDITFGEDLNETGASSAIAANFGMGFPRVELSIFKDSIVPWAQPAYLIGGTFTTVPPCQTADAEFLGAAGYDLGFLGFNLVSGSKTFFDEKYELLRAGDCPEN